MRIIATVLFVITVLLSLWFLPGCGPKEGVYGQPITETNVVGIGDILKNPEQFDKKTVLIEGKIVEECPTGGWFMLQDENGVLYVDLHASYFAIPQAVGHKAAAQGVIGKDGPRVFMTGKGVQIK